MCRSLFGDPKMRWLSIVFIISILAGYVYGDTSTTKKCSCSSEVGTRKSPGQSCVDIFKRRIQEPLPDGTYWISLAKGYHGLDQQFPVYCDMDSGGWTMVFKTVSGGARANIGKWWKQSLSSSESVVAALNTNNVFKGVYKNRIVNDKNWGKFQPKEVRLVLYKHGVEQLVLRFNARSSTPLNWFSQARLLESPWHDITHSTFNYFTIQGPCWHGECRDFHINHYYNGCPADVGWLSLGNAKVCKWENRFHGNSFLYSKIGRKVNYHNYHAIGDADVFAVYVK